MGTIGSILSAAFSDIADAIVDGIVSYFTGIQQRRADVKAGQAQQAATETAASGKAEAAEAQAEATVDRSTRGIEQAAREGRF